MTTGATIHTTQGLNMTVTSRTKPPIVPSLQISTLEVDPSISISGKEEIGQKDQVYQAQNS
jgi:beta-ring hydroxylase